jgi:hypothetical protein
MTRDSAAIREQLGNDSDTFQVLVADFNETVIVEELSTIVSGNSLGHVWIAGVPGVYCRNSINGTWTGTEDGEQLIIGGTGVDTGRETTVKAVFNPFNIYYETFRFEDFKSTPHTADWNTTLYRLAMTTDTDQTQIYNTVATFSEIYKGGDTIQYVKITATETKFGNDNILYYVSVDNLNWETITLNETCYLNTQGTSLYLRIIFVGNGANQTYLEELRVNYG